MIELPTFAVVVLGFFATIGLASILGWFSPLPIRRRIKMDMETVNSSRHMLMAALTNQAHREGDPEF
jgi:hypothetical protein